MRNPFWSFAREMLRYRRIVVPALGFAALSAGGLGAGLLGLKPVIDIIWSIRPPAAVPGMAAVPVAPPKDLPNIARELNASLPGWSPRIPDGVINALPTGAFTAVLCIVSALGVLTILGAACNFLHAYLALTVISRTTANIRRRAFHRVIHLPLKTVLREGPSDLISRIVYDTASLGAGFNAMLSKAVAQATKGAVALATAFMFNWAVAAAALGAGLVLGVIIKRLGTRIRRASRSALKGQAELYHAANEVLTGLRVVKVHAGERAEAGRFHRINKQVVASEFKVRTARALASPLVEVITIFALGVLALVSIKVIIDRHLEPSDFAMVLGSLGLAAASLKPLVGLHNDIQQSSAAASRLHELLAHEPEPGHARVSAAVALSKLPRHARDITFEDVSLTYAGAAQPALDRVSLTIPHGRTVAFVGPNGSGKTTLLSLIPRLFDPDAGAVLIDGRDVREASIRSLRRQIAVVTQETVLFRGTIRGNIAYGAEGVGGADDATLERAVRQAARQARAEEFILAKPGGYDHALGEGGAGLSGGQKQRIAIARAILRDPAILILDEATSMIDAESEAAIADAIAAFVGAAAGRRRTCLIVAHRLSTVLTADTIVVMDRGRIADRGSHAELMDRSPVYRAIAANQLVGGVRPNSEEPALAAQTA